MLQSAGCIAASPCTPGAVLTDIPSAFQHFPQSQPFQHLLPLLVAKLWLCLPSQGYFCTRVHHCWGGSPAEGMQTQPRQGSHSLCQPFLPLSLFQRGISYPFSLTYRSLVQLIFNSYTPWDNLNWGDEGNLVPGCVGSLLNSCLGRWKAHSHLSLSNQAEMDLKISPITDSSHTKRDLGFCFLPPTCTTQREETLVVCLSLLGSTTQCPILSLTLESALAGFYRPNSEPFPSRTGIHAEDRAKVCPSQHPPCRASL